VGSILIVLNPFKALDNASPKYMAKYITTPMGEHSQLPPHIFKVAQSNQLSHKEPMYLRPNVTK
jgi:myosin heavy subunit